MRSGVPSGLTRESLEFDGQQIGITGGGLAVRSRARTKVTDPLGAGAGIAMGTVPPLASGKPADLTRQPIARIRYDREGVIDR